MIPATWRKSSRGWKPSWRSPPRRLHRRAPPGPHQRPGDHRRYATKTQPLSATRSYPNLSEADLSLIPKSIEEKGKTLTLADVQWSSSEQTDGAGGTVTRYTAAASYTGTSSYQYATGYTVTANYTGEVAKTGCSVVTYTAIFGSMEAPEESTEPESGNSTASAGVDLSTLKMPLLVGGVVVILAAGGVFVFKKLKERR